ncbi:hydrogenase small subunit [Granulicella rosea]|uniref:Hydrogenase small subunit n=1 Tax=Granulicella rosea TaxID=474952 RepID=A0A239GQM1_9BACT|nr:hydrogenase small subunit [Granulicella rosea]SNS71261.1 hydrogenase small subunit [Granulicella rosea]
MLDTLIPFSKELETIDQRLQLSGISRRSFLVFCTSLMVAAPFGLALTDKASPEAVAAVLGKVVRPPIIWLHFQDCTGCTESLLQTSYPGFADLILNVISLEYHETLMAGSGLQARQALDEAIQKYAGKYILVVEGSIPTGAHGVYMKSGGRTAMEVLADVGGKAAAIIAIGSCASWGGIPSADPDPTGAVGVADLMPDHSIINIPGCPPNPYTMLGVVLQYAADGTFPETDEQRRPKFAFDRDIHEHCPRRAHFDAGNFVKVYGDAGHREGWCLYEMGCKGPDTHAGCSTRHFNEIPDVWPIGIGAPCIGCTEKAVAFKVPMFQVVQLHTIAAPPTSFAPITTTRGTISPLATGLVGLGVGVLATGGYVASRQFSKKQDDESAPGSRQDKGTGA